MGSHGQLAFVEPSAGGRGRVRRQLGLEATASGSLEESASVLIHNISEAGLLIETTASLAAGELIEVDLPHAGARKAEVMWNSATLFGCKFVEEVTTATVSAALLRAPITGSVPERHFDAAAQTTPEELEERLSPRTKLFKIVALALLAWAIVVLGASRLVF
jgi:hypothetical protein